METANIYELYIFPFSQREGVGVASVSNANLVLLYTPSSPPPLPRFSLYCVYTKEVLKINQDNFISSRQSIVASPALLTIVF
jgi:hypothetical protein